MSFESLVSIEQSDHSKSYDRTMIVISSLNLGDTSSTREYIFLQNRVTSLKRISINSPCEGLMKELYGGRGYMGTRRPNAGAVPSPSSDRARRNEFIDTKWARIGALTKKIRPPLATRPVLFEPSSPPLLVPPGFRRCQPLQPPKTAESRAGVTEISHRGQGTPAPVDLQEGPSRGPMSSDYQ
ncbi:hypothetical protein L3X38_015389 [Prunus dulcis]|uniref:Uncharacterized protein n=1 Tax=Prunus dulcis TaxID=3755 RepID=A0AAD4WQ11_PRUDU|nr:hypothetical protein L3X38_015389 [Prunus dulcis]